VSLRYGASEATVRGWIRQGDLLALNVARRLGGRPTWCITENALEDFEKLRASRPAVAPPRPRKHYAEVFDFIR